MKRVGPGTAARVEANEADGVVEITLSGEIDLTSADALQDQLERAIDGKRAVVVDLRPVTYLDSRGIRLLVQVARGFRGKGGQFTAIAPKESIAGGVLRLTHVEELDLDGAAGGGSSPAS
jgi:anti-anti-sigma factor